MQVCWVELEDTYCLSILSVKKQARPSTDTKVLGLRREEEQGGLYVHEWVYVQNVKKIVSFDKILFFFPSSIMVKWLSGTLEKAQNLERIKKTGIDFLSDPWQSLSFVWALISSL